MNLDNVIDGLRKEGWPESYAKPTIVVPDYMVDAFKEFYGSAADVTPLSSTIVKPID